MNFVFNIITLWNLLLTCQILLICNIDNYIKWGQKLFLLFQDWLINSFTSSSYKTNFGTFTSNITNLLSKIIKIKQIIVI